MEKSKMTMADKIVEAADLVYGTAVDRTVERMEQAELNAEKDMTIVKNVGNIIIEAAETVTEAAADHVAGLLNGEKLDLTKEKNRAIETIDKLVDKADEYYGMITDRIVEKMEQHEQNIEKDIETGKQLVKDLNSYS